MPLRSKAEIVDGVWVRNVPWRRGQVWRSDVFKSVLGDERLEIAEFHLEGGPIVRIPKSELVRAISGGPDHYQGRAIWGPFDIDPRAGTVAGERVAMKVVDRERA